MSETVTGVKVLSGAAVACQGSFGSVDAFQSMESSGATVTYWSDVDGQTSLIRIARMGLSKCYLAGFAGLVSSTLLAADRPAEGIEDNSFLVEEAYNQEAGVVQHIFNLTGSWDKQSGDKMWLMTFYPGMAGLEPDSSVFLHRSL